MKPRSLTKKSEFTKVYEEGQKLVSRSLVLYMLPAPENARSVVASRKIGGAVQRNLAKRRLREVLRKLNLPAESPSGLQDATAAPVRSSFSAHPENAASGLWIVAIARRALLYRDTNELESELSRLLSGRPTSPDLPRHGTPKQ